MNPALDSCLRAATEVPARERVADWWPRWRDGAARAATPVAQALLGGFDADRVGWAFAAGYQAALRRLCPDLPAGSIAALCVTEEAGNRPRDIATRLEPLEPAEGGGWRLSGAKRWTTLGPAGSLLLVAARLTDAAEGAEGAEGVEGKRGARPRLKVARVPVPAPGLSVEPMAGIGFVPEVPHARLRFDGVAVAADALLPGDGWDQVVKPFRTIEDLHVTLAVLAYLLREARARDWPAGFRERVVATLVVLTVLAAERASAAATHVALEGALQWAHQLYAEAATLWSGAGDEAAARWQRDAALFGVAGTARAARALRAWERVAQASKGGGDDDE